jgi:hypothetical protein
METADFFKKDGTRVLKQYDVTSVMTTVFAVII